MFLSFQVWDFTKKGIRNIFRGHEMAVESVDFSPNARLIASASWDDTVRIFSMRDGSAKGFPWH
jgi:WD40 repeat protein